MACFFNIFFFNKLILLYSFCCHNGIWIMTRPRGPRIHTFMIMGMGLFSLFPLLSPGLILFGRALLSSPLSFLSPSVITLLGLLSPTPFHPPFCPSGALSSPPFSSLFSKTLFISIIEQFIADCIQFCIHVQQDNHPMNRILMFVPKLLIPAYPILYEIVCCSCASASNTSIWHAPCCILGWWLNIVAGSSTGAYWRVSYSLLFTFYTVTFYPFCPIIIISGSPQTCTRHHRPVLQGFNEL